MLDGAPQARQGYMSILMGSLCSLTLVTKGPGGASGAGFLRKGQAPIGHGAARVGREAADPISGGPGVGGHHAN